MNGPNRFPVSVPVPRVAGRSARLWAIFLMVATLAMTTGCGLLRTPQRVVNSVVPGNRSPAPNPLELQEQIERFTDNFTLRTTQALDDYAQKVGTESARIEALQLKLLSASAVTSIASGPHPTANLLDLVAVVTLSRMAVEERCTKAANGSAYELWLATGRVLESNVWQLAAIELKPAHLAELRETIIQYWRQNPEAHATFFARPQEFVSLAEHSRKQGADLTSVFSLIDLDPTSGLDPAVREVTQTRLLAERAMFTLQRLPFLLRWQTELLAYELAGQPEVRLALTNTSRLADSADRISRATESASQTAALLPDRVSTERKEILAALDQQEGKLRELAAQVDRALESGAKMSTSLDTTIGAFDTLMKRFGVGEPSTNAAPAAPDTNSPPFNILDYGQVADRVAAMAKEINTLVVTVNQSVPQIQRLSQQTSADAQQVVDRGFHLGLVLIAVLLIGGVLAGLLYRVLLEKLKRRGRSDSAPKL